MNVETKNLTYLLTCMDFSKKIVSKKVPFILPVSKTRNVKKESTL